MNVDFFFSRLKSERKKLGLSQTELAEKCNVSATTYSNYELGKRKPDSEFLQYFSDIGGDVHFLFTGQKTVGSLDGLENMVLAAFNGLDDSKKLEAIGFLSGLGKSAVGGVNQSAGGNVSNMVAGNQKRK